MIGATDATHIKITLCLNKYNSIIEVVDESYNKLDPFTKSLGQSILSY